MTPEQKRAYDREYRKRNLEKIRARQREWLREKHGSIPRAEYLAKLAKERDEKRAATLLARQQEKAIRQALKAQKMAIENRTRTKCVESPIDKRKPGRLMAMAGWLHW